jgi:hypothetical protein
MGDLGITYFDSQRKVFMIRALTMAPMRRPHAVDTIPAAARERRMPRFGYAPIATLAENLAMCRGMFGMEKSASSKSISG